VCVAARIRFAYAGSRERGKETTAEKKLRTTPRNPGGSFRLPFGVAIARNQNAACCDGLPRRSRGPSNRDNTSTWLNLLALRSSFQVSFRLETIQGTRFRPNDLRRRFAGPCGSNCPGLDELTHRRIPPCPGIRVAASIERAGSGLPAARTGPDPARPAFHREIDREIDSPLPVPPALCRRRASLETFLVLTPPTLYAHQAASREARR